MPEISLGIDFGTTTTLISFREPGLLPQVLPIGLDGLPYMPSAVAFLPRSHGAAEKLVGEEALRAGPGADVVTSVKRCLHCDGSRCLQEGGAVRSSNRRNRRAAASHFCCRDGQLAPGGQLWNPEDIAFLIIEEALRRASRHLQGHYNDRSLERLNTYPLILGCSVAFDLDQRQLLSELAHRLGFSRVTLSNVVEEPVAAGVGFAYLEGLRPGRTLIYDFGGGTFDAAVVDVDREVTQVAVLGSSGVSYLGGDDIDQMILEYFLDRIGDRHGLSRSEVESLVAPGVDERELRRRAEEAKIDLSRYLDTEATVSLDAFGVEKVRLSREDLEAILAQDRRFDGVPLFERSEQCVKDVLRRAKAFDLRRQNAGHLDRETLLALPLEELVQGIDQVLLVGGVTKVPYVKERLSNLFGERRLHEGYILDDPVTAVAQGAALDKEYENLVLASPPYSIVLSTDGASRRSSPEILYRAYDPLWPCPRSLTRADIRFVSETVFLSTRTDVYLRQYDGSEHKLLYSSLPNQYLRVEIDLGARIVIVTGPEKRDMRLTAVVRAPWQHAVQVVPEGPSEYSGHIWDTQSIMTEK